MIMTYPCFVIIWSTFSVSGYQLEMQVGRGRWLARLGADATICVLQATPFPPEDRSPPQEAVEIRGSVPAGISPAIIGEVQASARIPAPELEPER